MADEKNASTMGTSSSPAGNGSSVPVKKAKTSWVPDWVMRNLKSPASWKLLLRCWIASWASFVLILPNKTLKIYGNAAFFVCMVSLIMPPSLPAQLFILVMITLIFGCLLGWGLGAAAMKAALAVRDQVQTAQELQAVKSSVAGLANPDALFQISIFKGQFLDTKSTIMFGAFLAVGTFIAAFVRAYYPKLALMSLYLTIFIDIFCSYGPLFPFAQYTILNSFLESVASFTAIALVVTFFIFPETLSHQWLNDGVTMLGFYRDLIEIQEDVLGADPNAGELTPGSELGDRIVAKKELMLAKYQALSAKTPLLSLEFRYSKWSGDDVKELEPDFWRLCTKIIGLQSYARLLGSPYWSGSSPSTRTVSRTPSSSKLAPEVDPTADSHLLRHLLRADRHAEETHLVRTTDVNPIVRDATMKLRAACIDAIKEAETVLKWSNSRNSTLAITGMGPSAKKEDDEEMQATSILSEKIESLRAAIAEFSGEGPGMILGPFRHILKESVTPGSVHSRVKRLPLRNLFVSVTFASNLLWTAGSIMDLLERIEATRKKRTHNHLWFPKGLRALGHVLNTRNDATAKGLGETGDIPNTSVVPDKKKKKDKKDKDEDSYIDFSTYQLDPDSSPPTNAIQKIGAVYHSLMDWCHTKEAIFIFKYVVASIALWLPQVFHSTAFFNYSNRGIWALIMAQTTLTVTMSEQLHAYVSRIGATVAGLVVGLVAWYIGAPTGVGTPYGIAAVMGVFLVPLLFIRIFSPYQLESIMFTVTFVLIMGYSWVDGHLPLVSNPGVGWPVAWRRFTLVMIGSAASFILMLFPSVSGRRLIRLQLSKSLLEILELYTSVISTWMYAEDNKMPSDEFIKLWAPKFRERLLDVGTKLYSMRASVKLAKWEGAYRGNWRSEEYASLVERQIEMVGAIAQLSGALQNLPVEWRRRLLHRTKFLNPHFITDMVSVLSAISQSLQTGRALHQVLPQSLSERVFYHGSFAPARNTSRTEEEIQDELIKEVEGLAFLQSLEFMAYASAVTSVAHLLATVDEVHRITKRLCGEVPLRGYDRWKSEFDRVHWGLEHAEGDESDDEHR
ncbi:hypothetical protein SISSUDRAFT_1052456 [Sistotremastrum suecicum HHB10207 ss-3]|uniref:ER transporter 6TM N-terminal domain-containing protein n=1 Tax=Sistotremastrum suecicum HHB10207 ss-3 TaxID=1314776 RepID=A0A165ZUU2_9AGAM|nr:hypothetical protein SISSUDRAFT_1052456 [Sistotremastrum suecicum HHB10207 ss-3]